MPQQPAPVYFQHSQQPYAIIPYQHLQHSLGSQHELQPTPLLLPLTGEDPYTEDDEVEPVNTITITPNSSAFRQTRTIQQSSKSHKPLTEEITIDFSNGGKQYKGQVLFKLLNSRYLYTVATTEPGIEKAFLLRAKDFPIQRDRLHPYESTTAEHLKPFNWFIINTVAMITQSNGQVLVWSEGTFDNANIVCVSFSVLESKWSSQLVQKKVAQKREVQKQRNLKGKR
jgi:hypothetical protein